MTMIEYFNGVKVGLGKPSEFYGSRSPISPVYRLRSVYVDYLDDYVFWWSSGRGSVFPFHDFLSEIVLNRLGKNNCKYFRGYNSDYSVDIIYTPGLNVLGRFIEIETGRKHNLGGLIMRLNKYKNFFYVVVPNSMVKRRYKSDLPVFHGRLLTLKEFMNLSSY